MSLFDNGEIRQITAANILAQRAAAEQAAPPPPPPPVVQPAPALPSPPVRRSVKDILAELFGGSLTSSRPRVDYANYGIPGTKPVSSGGGLGLMGYSVEDAKRDAMSAREGAGNSVADIAQMKNDFFNKYGVSWDAINNVGAGGFNPLDSGWTGDLGNSDGLDAILNNPVVKYNPVTAPATLANNAINNPNDIKAAARWNPVTAPAVMTYDYMQGKNPFDINNAVQQSVSPDAINAAKTIANTNPVLLPGRMAYDKFVEGKNPLDIGNAINSSMPGGGGGYNGGDGFDTGGMPYLGDIRGLSTLGAAGQVNPYTIENSPWRTMALDKQAGEQSKLLDANVKQNMTAGSMAMDNLAMNGGLRSGAAERIARGSADNLATSAQGIMGQGAIDRANIGMEGAKMDTDVSKFNSNAMTGANQINVGNAINDLANQNSRDQLKYTEGMKLKGAGMSANAIAGAGKK